MFWRVSFASHQDKNFLNGGRRAFGFVNGVRKIRILYLLPELRFKEMAEFPLSLKFDARCP